MRIIKRNGAEVGFDITKIIIAITKANEAVAEADRMTPVQSSESPSPWSCSARR